MLVALSFSPPYGDGTDAEDKANAEEMFSPPYGDGTQVINFMGALYKFSPPYGDGTVCWNDGVLCMQVFAPLRGWYDIRRYYYVYHQVFAPLRG